MHPVQPPVKTVVATEGTGFPEDIGPFSDVGGKLWTAADTGVMNEKPDCGFV